MMPIMRDSPLPRNTTAWNTTSWSITGSFAAQRRRQQYGNMELWRLILFLVAVVVVIGALSFEAARGSAIKGGSGTNSSSSSASSPPSSTSQLNTATNTTSAATPQSVAQLAVLPPPVSLPDTPVIGTGGTRNFFAESSPNSASNVSTSNTAVYDDNSFLIQGEVQIVEAKSVDPVIICCLQEQGRAIRLAGIDSDAWNDTLVNTFIADAIAYARQHYQGKMLFEVVSKDYDAFGNLFGYLYIPYDGGMWWHPSYQERFYQVNLQLVRRGYVKYMPNQDSLYKQHFKKAEEDAKREFLGMWR